jgi:RHH-type transcriptional regulator, proline utilization regulon repressor / proline dehydrogenase / delta 1-pyrroline-5-carboxylate dehydrogenase
MLDGRAIEAVTRRIGAEILGRITSARQAGFREGLSRDPLVAWSGRGATFLANTFRFIDVFPVLRSDEDLLEHLRAYMGDGSNLLPMPSPTEDLPGAVRALVTRLKERFIAGETLLDALKQIRRLREAGLCATLDFVGEAVLSEREAREYQDAYLTLIPQAAKVMAEWPARAILDASHDGPVPRLNISVKLTSLYHRFDAIDPKGSFDGVAPGLRAIFRAAIENGAAVNVDMEQYVYKDLTIEIFKRILMEDEFREWPNASVTIQTYLPESRQDLIALADWANQRGTAIHLRVAKGAYWDHETHQAAYHGWPRPVYRDKAKTDAEYEWATQFVLEHHNEFLPAIAGHNVRSVAHAMAVAEGVGLPRDCVEYQTLYGLGEEQARAMADMGYRVRVYAPFGTLVAGMAYLVRRLLEATSRSAFLRQMWAMPLKDEELLSAPSPQPEAAATAIRDGLGVPFANEPVSDFSRREAREAMARAIAEARRNMGGVHAPRIAGHVVETKERMTARNPGLTSEILGRVALAGEAQAEEAVRAAREAFPAWAARSARERASVLARAAQVMRARRYDLAAWEVFETAKSWREADADVAEAVDYLEYYAREAVRLAEPRHENVSGERNEYFYVPRGVAVAIAPWNFPLAILTGITSAAVVAGNTVIMKPALPASIVASKLMDTWTDAGIPAGVIQYLPGKGSEIGDLLVRHPDVQIIGFTGSLEVGLRIQRLATEVGPAQSHLKRVIAEMGGKNAIIVDRDADLDQAVPGILVSAFGYQGQKCSACSRVIALREVYETLLRRLVEGARSLPIGPAWDPHASIGPVINADAMAKVRRYAEMAGSAGRVVYRGDTRGLERDGHYIGPVIVADVPPDSPLAQEEIFGPVLSVIPADHFDHALAIANGTRYALTGGLYSRHPANIDRARREFRAGNLYVNRPITGAMVRRQPFGGLSLSGIGSKAGGPDYLLQFMQPLSFSEYTVRRGFAPPE